MSTEIKDIFNDTNAIILNRIVHQFKPDEALMKEARADTTTYDQLNDASFADPIHRKYPCHTKAATWFSYGYFLENKSKHTPATAKQIQSNFRKFASLWGIDLPKRTRKTPTAKKVAYSLKELPDDCFALCVKQAGVDVRHYPLTSPQLIKTAAEDFTNRTYRLYTREHRKTMARNILKAAEAHNVELEDHDRMSLEAMAGYGYLWPKRAAANIRRRYRYFESVSEKAAALSEKLENVPVENVTPELIDKVVDTLEALDKEAGIRHRILMPEHIVLIAQTYAQQLKKASFKLDSSTFAVDDLRRIPMNKLLKLADKSAVNKATHPLTGEVDYEKLASVLETLPPKRTSRLRVYMEHV